MRENDAKRSGTYLDRAFDRIAAAGRPLCVSELADIGINRTTLSHLVEDGRIERPVRGVYHVPTEGDDPRVYWACVSLAYRSVFCLASAADYHGLTEEMPGIPDAAVPKAARIPGRSSFDTRVRFHRWGDRDLVEGVDRVFVQGVEVFVTSPARTVVDMYRFSTLSDCPAPSVTDASFHDCLARYLECGDQNAATAELRGVAGAFGVWADIDRICSLIGMTKSRMTSH